MKRKVKKITFNIFVGVLIIIGLIWICSRFVHLGNVEFTDNAQVKQLIIPVNSRVQGFISKIYFNEYSTVRQGDTLAIIEDTEFRLRVAQAEADYQNALSGKSAMATTISTTHNNLSVSDAGIEEMKILLQNAEKDYLRYKKLLAENAVTQQQYDGVKTNYDAMRSKYEMLVRQKQSTNLVKTEQTQRLEQTESGIKLAEAALELAKLNLSYTVILAPCDGTTGRKNIQAGQLIQPGQTIVDVVDDNDKWIVANYKETQTANIQDGQEVEIEADAVPDVVFKGIVKSVSRATGASFSLLPQDNSAGNFVKIQQRIPVRIEFSEENKPEDMKRLGAGMNVECTVKLSEP
jgi:membrane fusion protein (multidrug efflux system)